MAKPSERLCSPIPTAIDIPTSRATSAGGWGRSVWAAAIAPGPMLTGRRGRDRRVTYSSPSSPALAPTPNPRA